jgi:hypothetical protein
MGELWVEYGFTIINRKQQTPLGQSNLVAHVVESASGTATAAAPLGTGGGFLRGGSTIPIVTTNTTFTLPQLGVYLVSITWVATGIVGVAVLSPGTNITNTPAIIDDNAIAQLSIFNTGGTSAMYIGLFTVASAGIAAANTITISGLSTMSAGKTDIFVTQVSSGILLPELQISKKKDEISRIVLLERELRSMSNALQSISLDRYAVPSIGGPLPPHPSHRLSVDEPCSPDEFKTTDCDLKCCLGCRDRPASIGSTYCSACTQRIEAKHKSLRVAWTPDS